MAFGKMEEIQIDSLSSTYYQLMNTVRSSQATSNNAVNNNVHVSSTNPISSSIPKSDTFTKQTDDNAKSYDYKFRDPIFFKDNVFNRTALKVLSPITPFRRISSMPDNVDDGNYVRAAGLGILALNFLPEDCRDIRDAAKQIANKFSKKIKYVPSYRYQEYQHDFSFFKGTLLEFLMKIPGKRGQKLAEILYNSDKTLYSTKFGKFLRKIFKVREVDWKDTEKRYGRDFPIFMSKFEGNLFSENVARGLKRTTVLSVAALAGLELINIYRAAAKGKTLKEKSKNCIEQTLKSVAYICSITAGIAFFGGWLSKKGAAGSLFGMGVGSVIGAAAYNLIKTGIDKVFKDKN